jgi:hypothetical protein
VSFIEEVLPLAGLRWLRLLVLAALLVLVGAVAFQLKFSVIDLDVWWHLKVGDWIIQHAAFPHNGILSRSAADHPWAAYSWGYEVLLSRFYGWFNLIGIGLYGTLLTLMVAFSVYWMLRRLSGRFWFGCLLAVLCCYSFLFLMMPRPVFFSIALTCLTLALLLESERGGDTRHMYWLPLIFLFWANLHIQFIYGLAIVALFVGIHIAQRLAVKLGISPGFVVESQLPVGRLLLILSGCALATLIGPYSYHLYGIVFAYSRSQLIYSMIKELQPLSFRAYENYVELFLAGAAFFTIAWQKRIDLFKLALMVMATILAFRTMRDSWFLCVVAAACIADVPVEASRRDDPETLFELASVFTMVAIGLSIIAPGLEFNTRRLDRTMTTMFPVNAVNFVHQNHMPGPLYNNFDWGGFLTWYMPDYPVVVDGRTDLYGDELNQLLLSTQNGDASYRDNPYLNDAGVVLLRRGDGLVPTLQLDSRFQKVYEDKVATVFVRP